MYMFIYIYISSIILESTSQVFRTEQFTQLSHSVSKPNTGWNSERLRNTVEEVETISNLGLEFPVRTGYFATREIYKYFRAKNFYK